MVKGKTKYGDDSEGEELDIHVPGSGTWTGPGKEDPEEMAPPPEKMSKRKRKALEKIRTKREAKANRIQVLSIFRNF